jgi:PAS domain S-box-containing protein/putative nucleotidyltransferase with HDIG domain
MSNHARPPAMSMLESNHNHILDELSSRYSKLFEAAQDGILLLSYPEGQVIDANPYILDLLGYSKEELMGKRLWEIGVFSDKVKAEEVHEKILRDGYVRYEDLDLVRKQGRRLSVEVICNAYKTDGQKLIQCNIRDISVRKEAADALDRERTRVSQQIFETVNSLSNVIEARDPYTASHQRRVTALAISIAREIGLAPSRIDGLRFACQIHDIGKISIPTEILTKPTLLNSMEVAILRGHAQAGYDILKPLNFPWPVAKIIFQHHERLDGSGYPLALKGEDISLEARILAVADTVEAMTSDRPYRPALGIDNALKEIEVNSGVFYDPEVVQACLKIFREGKFEFPKEPEASYHKL